MENMKDHRDIAKDMDLFHFEEHSPGMVFWHPKGFVLFKAIEDYMRTVHKKYGYLEIKTPLMLNRSLWEKSGHWEKFAENMFVIPADNDEKQTYAMKPMSCPAHIEIYRKGLRSYKDLPLRYNEFGMCHRNEPSGALAGIMRLRQFTQDDAHIFCTKDQILNETKNYIKMLREVYSEFNFDDFSIKFATRPENRVGSDEVWDQAEASLEDACKELELKYTINPGEGAFYGPKLEFTLKDLLDREWQCGTIQVDFNLTAKDRLDVSYINEQGEKEHPVLIHHAVLGSLERWVGVLLENQGGQLPSWLSPVQIVVASIVNDVDDYAREIHSILVNNDIRAELDVRPAKIGKKILEHTKAHVPLMVIVGRREEENGEINVRAMDGAQQNTTLDVLLKDLSILKKFNA